MGAPTNTAPLHPEEQNWLLRGMLISIARQGRLTPGVMQLPGLQRGFEALAEDLGEDEAIAWARSCVEASG